MAKNKAAQRRGIVFRFSWGAALAAYNDSQIREILYAALDYGQTGVAPAFTDKACGLAWGFIQPDLDADAQKYDAKTKLSSVSGQISAATRAL